MKKLGLLLIIILLAACAKQKDTSTLQEMLFEVDLTRVEQKFTSDSLGLSFHPPVKWKIIPDDLFSQFQQQSQQNDMHKTGYSIKSMALFLNMENQSMLSVSRIIPAENDQTLKQVMDMIQKNTVVDEGDRQIQRACYVKDNILIEQLLMQDQLRVVFKLVFQNQQHQWIEMDYITHKSEYEKEVKAIESSIGTILLEKK